MAEIITKDRKEYNIWDKINGVWNRLNFLTSASSVDASDGKDLQTKVGAINGISSSSTATDENIAASIGYVNQELNQINSDLTTDSILGDPVNLSLNKFFTAPCDGYLEVFGITHSDTYVYVCIYDKNMNVYLRHYARNTSSCLFIKKGLIIEAIEFYDGGSVKFFPLTK